MIQQLSMFEQPNISELLEELTNYLPCWSDLKYEVVRYRGSIQLCAFIPEKREEQIIDRSLYLQQNKNGLYQIMHFDSECIPGLIDISFQNKLLHWFMDKTLFVDDLQ